MDPDNLTEVINLVTQAIIAKNYGLVASAAVVLLVGLARKFLLPNVKAPWAQDKRLVLGLGFAAALAGGIGSALIAGTPFSVGLVVSVLLGSVGTWLTGVGAVSALKNAKEGGQIQAPQLAPSLVVGKPDPMDKLR